VTSPPAPTVGAASVAIVAAVALAMAAYGPIAAPPGYHDFADQSVAWGIPHSGDVLSNAAFAVVALGAMPALWPRRRLLGDGWPGYALLLAALAATAAGSTLYHLAPGNARLVWDRLPIALACAALLAAVHTETWQPRRWLLWAYGSGAVLSVGWWRVTELAGAEDLRPYLLLQGAPLVLIPLWQWAARRSLKERAAFVAAVLLYVLAKASELADHAVYELAGVSGHTVKHLCAALAAAAVIRGLTTRLEPYGGPHLEAR
jgi:hypothetical protein